jgi:thiamine biosynthesis lipoprotein
MVRGNHLVDPRTGRAGSNYLQVWVAAPTAAEADALSTAFMLMTRRAIKDYCDRHQHVAAWLLDRDDGPLCQIGHSSE